jgi:uncharacterized membrane protein YobD (UPF0266 family)
MGRYVNWYIVELERLLTGQLPTTQVAETLGEVEAHILDSSEALKVTCQHGEDPEKLAVDRFGTPRNLAVDMLLSRLVKPYWKAAILPVLATLLLFFMGALSRELRQDTTWLFFCLVAIVTLAISSWRNHQTSMRAMVLVSLSVVLVGSVFVAAAQTIFVNREHKYQQTVFFPSQISKLETDREWLEKGMQVFSASNVQSVPTEFRTRDGYVVGSKNPNYGRYTSTFSYGDMPDEFKTPADKHLLVSAWSGSGEHQFIGAEDKSLQHAQKWWSKEAPKAIGMIDKSLDDLRFSKDHYDNQPAFTVRKRLGKTLQDVSAAWFFACLVACCLNAIFAYGSRWSVVAKLDRRQFV